MGMDRPMLGLPALSSVCGYVRSFSRYGRQRVSPSVGVAIFHDDVTSTSAVWCQGMMGIIRLTHGQPTLSSVCGYVREKKTEKWAAF